MANPFEDADSTYMVLVNSEGQHSLWPASIDVPAGWEIVLPESGRDACLSYVDEQWTDMRPKSLIEATTR
ncbi:MULTISPECIES: MbtH family protein [unclassified Streptomyces]|uniref:MbtH family protein n=1 Tax=Streptomyces sp. NPDC127532 TaxID=3345399 RepID=UPI00362A901C